MSHSDGSPTRTYGFTQDSGSWNFRLTRYHAPWTTTMWKLGAGDLSLGRYRWRDTRWSTAHCAGVGYRDSSPSPFLWRRSAGSLPSVEVLQVPAVRRSSLRSAPPSGRSPEGTRSPLPAPA